MPGAGVMQRVIGQIYQEFKFQSFSEDEFYEYTGDDHRIILCKRNRNLWLYRIRNERGVIQC